MNMSIEATINIKIAIIHFCLINKDLGLILTPSGLDVESRKFFLFLIALTYLEKTSLDCMYTFY